MTQTTYLDDDWWDRPLTMSINGDKMTEISWYNFTHPNQDAIEKRDKFLEEPINDCINCTHFHFNNDGSTSCDAPYECTLKHKIFELIAQKTSEEYLKTIKEEIQHYGELEK